MAGHRLAQVHGRPRGRERRLSVFDLQFTFDAVVVGTGLGAGGLLVGLSGVFATYSVVRQPPGDVLAQGS